MTRAKLEMKRDEVIKATHGHFTYFFQIIHHPDLGYSVILFNHSRIGRVQSYRIYQPKGNDVRELENYSKEFVKWREEIINHMERIFKYYLNVSRNQDHEELVVYTYLKNEQL